jgi:hypothetical protein
MSLSLFQRAQEWLADRVDWVQYPNVRTSNQRSLFWKYEMPWYQRMALAVMGFGFIGVSLIALFFLGLLFWALVTTA